MLNVSLRQLETFVAVAATRSFRLAAERLCRSQSAVSEQIQQLEAALEVKLFRRTTRQVQLTPCGERLQPRVEAALRELDAGIEEVRYAADLKTSRLAIACSPSLACTTVPHVIAAFRREHPAVAVQLREGFGETILEQLRSRASDFGIGPAMTFGREFRFERLLRDEFCALSSLELAPPGREEISLTELSRWPTLVMPRESAMRPQLEAAFAALGLALRPGYEVLNAQTILGMAAAGLGVGVLPRLMVPAEGFPGLRTLTIVQPALWREIGVITLANEDLSRPAQLFIALLKSMMGAAPALSGRRGRPAMRTSAEQDSR